MTWTNDDNFTHSVGLEGAGVADRGHEAGGVRRPTRSTAPGSYPYVCTFHPQDMRGVVEVVAG